jgi:hypothetical protein
LEGRIKSDISTDYSTGSSLLVFLVCLAPPHDPYGLELAWPRNTFEGRSWACKMVKPTRGGARGATSDALSLLCILDSGADLDPWYRIGAAIWTLDQYFHAIAEYVVDGGLGLARVHVDALY